MEARPLDTERLCEVATAAFLEDRQYQPETALAFGPPGHDDVSFHLRWIEDHHYIKYVADEIIVGGCVVNFESEYAEIHGLFVDPEMMNKGIGKKLILHLFDRYSGVRKWVLETPDYAIRNQTFYEKLGFVCVQRTKAESRLGFGFCKYEVQVHD